MGYGERDVIPEVSIPPHVATMFPFRHPLAG
jgi:hypothetical protein